MYKIVYWRYGSREIEEVETLAEANRHFNYIGEYEVGFAECILDENDIIIRDGNESVIGIRKEKRKGTKYIFE